MIHTNINIDAIEVRLPTEAIRVRANLIEEAVKRINVWLTPDPQKVEVVNISTYKNYDFEQKFSLDPVEQRHLIESMFDNNISLVLIKKTSEGFKKAKSFFSKTEPCIETKVTNNYLFTRTAIDINKDLSIIKDFLLTLRNPRVSLTVEEHKVFTSYLKAYNINLPDYYI